MAVSFANDNFLAEIAAGLRNSVSAAGVAVALESDGTFVCRAAAGDAAPEIGAQVSCGGGITGACISTGEEASWCDTDLDPRVNVVVCREMGIRSVLSVPLQWRGGVVGVVVAMFARAGASSDGATVESLRTAAHQIVSRVYGECSGPKCLDANVKSDTDPVHTIAVRGNTALLLDEIPVQDQTQDRVGTLRTAEDRVAVATEPYNPPRFTLLDSSLTSFDGIAEFLSRRYLLILAVIIGCVLLVTIVVALKHQGARRAGSGGFSTSSVGPRNVPLVPLEQDAYTCCNSLMRG